ncbi:MAG: hypothetical protein IPJ34_34505 [Myxococcales bacterium]|nr:hypothetical protein [Myxococcales bacterium]
MRGIQIAGLALITLLGCAGTAPATDPADVGAGDAVLDADADADAEAAADAAPTCAAGAVPVELSTDGGYAYPPYALDGCALAYLSKTGAVHLRDLARGTDVEVDPGPARRPTLAGDTLAWETVGASPTVRVRHAGGPIVTLPEKAGEPRAARDAVVFTRFLGADALGDTDVQLYVPTTGVTTTIAGGPGQQRFADVDDDWIAVTDFSEDPDGRFDANETDLADVVLYERRTGKISPRKRKGKQAFPILVGGGTVVYHEWDFIHPQPKLEVYELFRGKLEAASDADVRLASVVTSSYVRPAGRGGVVEWVVRDLAGVVTLFRARVAGGPTETVTGLAASDLLAPAVAADRTAIGVRGADGLLTLRILSR